MIGLLHEARTLARWADGSPNYRTLCEAQPPIGFRHVARGSNRRLIAGPSGSLYKVDIYNRPEVEGNLKEQEVWETLYLYDPSMVPDHHLWVFGDVAIMAVENIPLQVDPDEGDMFAGDIYRDFHIAFEDVGSTNEDNLRQREDGTIVLVDGGGWVDFSDSDSYAFVRTA